MKREEEMRRAEEQDKQRGAKSRESHLQAAEAMERARLLLERGPEEEEEEEEEETSSILRSSWWRRSTPTTAVAWLVTLVHAALAEFPSFVDRPTTLRIMVWTSWTVFSWQFARPFRPHGR